jgi:hypothetical protein
MKKCSKCGIDKELENFSKDKRAKNGLCCSCKDCQSKYREKNKEEINRKQNKYYKENKEEISQCVKKYRKQNREKINKHNKEYRLRNKEKLKKRRKKYLEENRKKVNKRQNECRKEKRKNDIIFKLSCNLRGSIHRAIKYGYKTESTQELLGCTWEEVLIYIESLFLPGMTWENWTNDGWHLDHIRPVASFDLTDPEQQKLCCHYTNLRPIWAEENYCKSSWWNGIKYSKNAIINKKSS